MHEGSRYRVKGNPRNLLVEVTEIDTADWATHIVFKVLEDSSTGRMPLHSFRETFEPYGIEG